MEGDGEGRMAAGNEDGFRIGVERLREWQLTLGEAGDRVLALSLGWTCRHLERRLMGIANDIGKAVSESIVQEGGLVPDIWLGCGLAESWAEALADAGAMLGRDAGDADGFLAHLGRVRRDMADAGRKG
jgi:hypothetical protein